MNPTPFSRYRVPVIFALMLLVAILVAFWEPLFSGDYLFSPDSPPFYPKGKQLMVFRSFWGYWNPMMLGVGYRGLPFYPNRILALVLPALVAHVAIYIVDVVLLCLAGVYFLRGLGIRGVAAYVPALALGFSGYAFTLISAGHMGIFEMMPYGVFLLACVDRAIRRGSAFHFGMAGLCAGAGLASQPDVMLLFGLLSVVYGAYLFFRTWVSRTVPMMGLLRRSAVGVVIALLAFAAVTPSFFMNFFQSALPAREAVRGETPEDKWEFATNWSMPPEEILELVAPCVYGIQTGDPKGPYWGRLGRTLGWEPGQRGLMNLKQHTLYLGVIPLLFGLYAFAGALRRRRRNGSPEEDAAAPNKAEPSSGVAAGGRADVFFWTGVFLVSVLLALGRHFPLYRLFYAIPHMSKIRCPVKFIHLTEVSVCILFGIGLAAFFADLAGGGADGREGPSDGSDAGGKGVQEADSRNIRLKKKRSQGQKTGPARPRLAGGLALLALVCGVGFLVASMVIPNFAGGLNTHWGSLGLGRYAPQIMKTTTGALTRTAGLFLAGALVFGVCWWKPTASWSAPAAAVFLGVLVFVDVTSLGRRYVNVRDISPFYASNPAAERVLAESEMGRTSYYLSARGKLDVLWRNFAHHLVDMLEPRADTVPSPEYRRFFQAVGSNPLRLWQITNTRFVIGQADKFKNLMSHPAFDVVGHYNVDGKGRVLAAQPGAPVMLLRYKGSLPRALVYHAWTGVSEEDALKKLAAADWDPARTVLVTGSTDSRSADTPTSPATVERYGQNHVRIAADIAEEGILLLNDAFDGDWRVTVDGEKAEVLRCNYLLRGVRLSPGKHSVVFTYRPTLIPFCLSVAAWLVMGAWGIARFLGAMKATNKDESV